MSDSGHKNWHEVTSSRFPWEKEALDYVRARFPAHEPYRAWSNFEFIADDGSINEVDLLLFTPQGFFLVEIKASPGVLRGDTQVWTFEDGGGRKVLDNPLFLTNLKAKKLASLLRRKRAFSKRRVPFIEPLVFCSAEELTCELRGNARFHVCLRDQEERPGIVAAFRNRDCPGLAERPRGTFDKPMAKAVGRALGEIGIKAARRTRRVGDYELGHMVDVGPGYQDFLGRHVSLKDTVRRIRVYPVQPGTPREQREMYRRAAEREFRLLQVLEHRGVLRAMEFTSNELGPTIIFQHSPEAMRLDHFLAERNGEINDDLRLSLIRQVAETIRFAHGKQIVHRGLSPRSILVVNPKDESPQAVVMNWQLGYRGIGGAKDITREEFPTVHADTLAEEATKIFMAPETLVDPDCLGEHLDVFSLGAMCYQLFTGHSPAESSLALAEKLRTQRGLRVGSVLNGAPESLELLVQDSTDPDVTDRLDTVDEFLRRLDDVERELTTPTSHLAGDPCLAKTGDILPGGFNVVRKLGTGSTATAFLVEKEECEYVMKIAVDSEHNERVHAEGEVIQKLDSPLFVRCHGIVVVNDRKAILLDQAGETTLGHRIRHEGRLSLEMLQRFGEDLIEAVDVLEREGIAHRDIKPDNIGVSAVGRGDALHLVLFDFSLSRSSPENIRAGTPGYLDPFLCLRKPPRWDLQAERFSAGVTLYQMATGVLPVWHDGKTDPTMVECEATIDAERFDSNLREQLTSFFERALRRDPSERFDNAQDMLRAWRRAFSTVTVTSEGHEEDNTPLLEGASLQTSVAELGLGAAAVDALDRINVVVVRDLLSTDSRRLVRMRGVGHKTRKRIMAAVKVLRKHLAGIDSGEPVPRPTEDALTYEMSIPKERLSVDILAQRVLRVASGNGGETDATGFDGLLGLDERITSVWPSQKEVAAAVGADRAQIAKILSKGLKRWSRDPALTSLRDQIVHFLEQNGGVMSVEELCQAVLSARGSIEEEPRRSRLAQVVARAAVETEGQKENARYAVRRKGTNVLVATDLSLADYAVALGDKADEIARQDPLVPPGRAVELLRGIRPPPEFEPLSDSRLLRLAAAASQTAAVSSRQEVYPRRMDAGRALKLSHGGLVGLSIVTVEQIHQRVRSRYPHAAALPGRPRLDKLLSKAGLELTWDSERSKGGAYVSTARNVLSVTSITRTPSRYRTVGRVAGTSKPHFQPNYVTPEVAEARQFEERLRHAESQGAFLALTVKPNLYARAKEELATRFNVRTLDLERVFVEALRKGAEDVGADWTVVVKADSAPRESLDWRNLNHLIAAKVVPQLETTIAHGNQTVLMYHLNWLARYDQVVLLSEVQQAVQDGHVHGVWLLIPASPQTDMPLLDSVAVPVITNNQWASIPESWCRNLHRADAVLQEASEAEKLGQAAADKEDWPEND